MMCFLCTRSPVYLIIAGCRNMHTVEFLCCEKHARQLWVPTCPVDGTANIEVLIRNMITGAENCCSLSDMMAEYLAIPF
jgi:hypothetical protein